MPVVDLSFHLTGTVIPADHGYSLFGAVCRLIPDFQGHLDAELASPGRIKGIPQERNRLKKGPPWTGRSFPCVPVTFGAEDGAVEKGCQAPCPLQGSRFSPGEPRA